MLDLYYWTTPNGHKITIFLEEAQLPYRIIPVNISKGEQFKPEFLRISPNNRIPALVDHEPADGGAALSVFESGAILLYLAEKTGRFIASDLRGRTETLEWLFWQMAGLGPMAGQNHHFGHYAPEKIPYAIESIEVIGQHEVGLLGAGTLVGVAERLAHIQTSSLYIRLTGERTRAVSLLYPCQVGKSM